MRYIVTADRPRANGAHCNLTRDDVIEVSQTTPDSDGDLFGRRLRDDVWSYVRQEDVRPEGEAADQLDERAVRAALLASEISAGDAAKIVALARAIASAL